MGGRSRPGLRVSSRDSQGYTQILSQRDGEKKEKEKKNKILKKICTQLSIIKFGASGMGLDRVFS